MKNYQIAFLSLISVAVSAPVTLPCPPAEEPTCREFLVPITASANNTLLPAFPDSTSPSAIYDYVKSLSTSPLKPFAHPVKGTFDISVRYCEPLVKVESRESSIQVLIHGLAYTKTYWNGLDFPNPSFPTEYSWIAHAASQGFATISVDSLGNGDSSHPDPVNTVQLPLQVEVIHNLISALRAGTIKSIPQKYKTVIVGSYSYGSILARTLATSHPTDAGDAYILTAAAENLTGFEDAFVAFRARAASVVDPKRFANLAPGYAAVARSAIRDTLYSFSTDYSPAVLAFDEASPHAFPVGEVASGAFAPTVASKFSGPVLVLTGRFDQIACGVGNITASAKECGVGKGGNPQMMSQLFPKSSSFGFYVADHTGHSINTHYSASENFGAAHQWLTSVGF